ncbi:Adaptive-response sensory-kinase SasA [Schaedlerella arabinosiphila]|nr:Adaptive-response sensory-kinase SasA [Schaedlerella arabinosiphila]
MNLKELFSLRTVRKKILITSKLAGAVLILSYLFSTHVSDDPDVSLLVWFAFMVPLILAVDFLMKWFISEPLSRLNAAAKKLAELDFSEPCTISSNDEFGELSDSLGQMSDNLQQALSRLETANIRLEDTNSQLELANNQLEDTNSQLEYANNQLEDTNSQLEHANNRLAADVTEKQRLLTERKELTDSLSHEMKTPVGVIRAYAEGIQDEADEEKRQKYAGIIIEETERMTGLITTLLDLSALETGATTLHMDVFDFVEFTETAAGRLLSDIPDARFQLEYELPEERIYVKTDRKRMEQVLDNLILNARKNVCPGGRLKLSLTRQGDTLRFSVYNQGTPIPEEILPKIWTKFYRSQDIGYRGSGLGLSIVAQVLSMQDLDYGVKNSPDGVVFYFSIPVTGCTLNLPEKSTPATSSTGKITAARIPFFKSSEAMLDTYPTSVGPPEQPRSPASANSANMAVPPFLMSAAPLLKLPGHMIPTDRPQTAQPTSENTGDGEREMHR